MFNNAYKLSSAGDALYIFGYISLALSYRCAKTNTRHIKEKVLYDLTEIETPPLLGVFKHIFYLSLQELLPISWIVFLI
jgi:hypothetical protein